MFALLFGSTARGTGPDSDLDIAVTGRDIDLLSLRAELTLALGGEAGLVSLDNDPPIARIRSVAPVMAIRLRSA